MTVSHPRINHQAPGESLTELLRKFADREIRKGKTQAQIAARSWLDESYVSRLFSGERSNPSRNVLLLICGWGLGLTVEDTDEVLMAADYSPLVLPNNR